MESLAFVHLDDDLCFVVFFHINVKESNLGMFESYRHYVSVGVVKSILFMSIDFKRSVTPDLPLCTIMCKYAHFLFLLTKLSTPFVYKRKKKKKGSFVMTPACLPTHKRKQFLSDNDVPRRLLFRNGNVVHDNKMHRSPLPMSLRFDLKASLPYGFRPARVEDLSLTFWIPL